MRAVDGEPINRKLTDPGDDAMLRAALGGWSVPLSAPAVGEGQCAGIGFDAHRLEEGRELHLGGLLFPGETGLAGHSDGDAALHAVIDALLGAARLGDVGGLFPPDDERWRDADSGELLKAAVERLREAGWRPGWRGPGHRGPPAGDRAAPRRAGQAPGRADRPRAGRRQREGHHLGRPRLRRGGGDRRVRRRHRGPRLTEWIGGRRPVAEALAAGREAHRLLVSKSARPSPELKQVLARAREASVPVETVPGDRIAALAGFDGHQGVLLEVGERRWADPAEMLARAEAAGRDPLILLLEHLQDPVNFGTLLRSAEAAGVDGVIFPERGAAPLSAAAVKASAGASEHLLLARVESLGQRCATSRSAACTWSRPTRTRRRPRGRRTWAGRWRWWSAARERAFRARRDAGCDLLVSFPMSGQVASLNAATAGALLLFEVVRQRSRAGGR